MSALGVGLLPAAGSTAPADEVASVARRPHLAKTTCRAARESSQDHRWFGPAWVARRMLDINGCLSARLRAQGSFLGTKVIERGGEIEQRKEACDGNVHRADAIDP